MKNIKEIRDEHYDVVGYTIDHGAGIEEYKDSHFDTVGYTIDQRKQFEDAMQSFETSSGSSVGSTGGLFYPITIIDKIAFGLLIGIPLVMILLGKSEIAVHCFWELLWSFLSIFVLHLFDSLIVHIIMYITSILRFLAMIEFIVLNWNFWT